MENSGNGKTHGAQNSATENLILDGGNLRSAIRLRATEHLRNGDDALAGALLVIERRLYDGLNDYAAQVEDAADYSDEEPAAAPAAKAPKCRHQWVGSQGENGVVVKCQSCGVLKSARGRKAAAPAPGAAS